MLCECGCGRDARIYDRTRNDQVVCLPLMRSRRERRPKRCPQYCEQGVRHYANRGTAFVLYLQAQTLVWVNDYLEDSEKCLNQSMFSGLNLHSHTATA
jgi:hypothetical protein